MIVKKIIDFFKEVKSELGKVNWPSKKQVKNHTIVVIAFSLFMAVFLGFIDLLLSLGLRKLI